VGVYPLLADETCWFLAIDFDKSTWQSDVAEVMRSCEELGVPASIERSRSGHGGHLWIFFKSPISAATARNLGCAVLTDALERRHQIGFDSYDRLFPSQDTMPKGGFGNLIALPLQRIARQDSNTVFLDRNLQPHVDQWRYLASVGRLTLTDCEGIVREAARAGKILGIDAYAAFQTGDLETVKSLFTSDITWHLPGHNHFSGAHKGVDKVLDLFMRNFAETNGTFKVELHDVLGNDEHAVPWQQCQASAKAGASAIGTPMSYISRTARFRSRGSSAKTRIRSTPFGLSDRHA
jgi:ketosteroid isomerase-like protein